jgi:hypothetical protein
LSTVAWFVAVCSHRSRRAYVRSSRCWGSTTDPFLIPNLSPGAFVQNISRIDWHTHGPLAVFSGSARCLGMLRVLRTVTAASLPFGNL